MTRQRQLNQPEFAIIVLRAPGDISDPEAIQEGVFLIAQRVVPEDLLKP